MKRSIYCVVCWLEHNLTLTGNFLSSSTSLSRQYVRWCCPQKNKTNAYGSSWVHQPSWPSPHSNGLAAHVGAAQIQDYMIITIGSQFKPVTDQHVRLMCVQCDVLSHTALADTLILTQATLWSSTSIHLHHTFTDGLWVCSVLAESCDVMWPATHTQHVGWQVLHCLPLPCTSWSHSPPCYRILTLLFLLLVLALPSHIHTKRMIILALFHVPLGLQMSQSWGEC